MVTQRRLQAEEAVLQRDERIRTLSEQASDMAVRMRQATLAAAHAGMSTLCHTASSILVAYSQYGG